MSADAGGIPVGAFEVLAGEREWSIDVGDCRRLLRHLPAGSVHAVVTSPPYFGLRDYGTAEWIGGDPACRHEPAPAASPASTLRQREAGRPRVLGDAVYDGEKRTRHGKPLRVCRCGAERTDEQIGLERTWPDYVQALVDLFDEVHRVLRDDGTVWLNLGDSYATRAQPRSDPASYRADRAECTPPRENGLGPGGVKNKDLIGVPWRVAFALQAAGWWLRADCVWAKPNPMPESVTDRPTRSHEFVFLLTKSQRYFYDAAATREQDGGRDSRNIERVVATNGERDRLNTHLGSNVPWEAGGGRNLRDVWTIAPQPFEGAHFAVYPPALVTPCVRSGSPSGGVVLDPFSGAGTTGLVAVREGRRYIGFELNGEYAALGRQRLAGTTSPLFAL